VWWPLNARAEHPLTFPRPRSDGVHRTTAATGTITDFRPVKTPTFHPTVLMDGTIGSTTVDTAACAVEAHRLDAAGQGLGTGGVAVLVGSTRTRGTPRS
jgi:hypothetical protein